MKLSLNSRIFSRTSRKVSDGQAPKDFSFLLIFKGIVLFAIVSAFGALILKNDHGNLRRILGSSESADLDKIYLQEGTKLFEAGNYDEAKRNIETALDINPSNADAIGIYQDLIEKNRTRIEVEIEHANEVIAKRPDYAAAWLKLSILYEQIGENGLSKKAKDEAMRLNPNLR